VEANLKLARQFNATVELLDGEDPVETIMDFARARGITQIFIGHSTHKKWWHRLCGNAVDRLIRKAEGIDVRVFPH
jgi:K+-sensing histidine kinase KdpD